SVLLPRVAKMFFESGKRVFYEMLAEYEEDIATHDEAKLALKDLAKEQRQQVAALLIDSMVSFEIYKPDARVAKELGELGREAPWRLRMLKRKIDKARAALEDLRDYSEKLHSTMRGNSRELSWERRDSKWAAEHCMKTLDEVELCKPESFRENYESKISLSQYPRDPTTFNMVKFYWLFRHGCELSGHESEVRVALIRNAFWTEWTKPVTVRHGYDGVESQGCDAVHRAVSRFRLDQGTTP
ncbi:hypothetical protein MYX82_06775, partial [Acidobacteria bacterium AH-259-D05]|nr:hypothetical protein [Acidobacteria bacterium AH-259-D05]